jgi:hypothetical protein
MLVYVFNANVFGISLLGAYRLGQPWMMAMGACFVAAGDLPRERRRLRFWWILFMVLTPIWQSGWGGSLFWRLAQLLPYATLELLNGIDSICPSGVV